MLVLIVESEDNMWQVEQSQSKDINTFTLGNRIKPQFSLTVHTSSVVVVLSTGEMPYSTINQNLQQQDCC